MKKLLALAMATLLLLTMVGCGKKVPSDWKAVTDVKGMEVSLPPELYEMEYSDEDAVMQMAFALMALEMSDEMTDEEKAEIEKVVNQDYKIKDVGMLSIMNIKKYILSAQVSEKLKDTSLADCKDEKDFIEFCEAYGITDIEEDGSWSRNLIESKVTMKIKVNAEGMGDFVGYLCIIEKDNVVGFAIAAYSEELKGDPIGCEEFVNSFKLTGEKPEAVKIEAEIEE